MGISRDQAISFIKNGCVDLLTHSEWVNDPIVQVEAISQDPSLIKYISNPSIRLQELAVKANWQVIKYIDNPHVDIQILALQGNREGALEYVDKKNKYIKKYLEEN